MRKSPGRGTVPPLETSLLGLLTGWVAFFSWAGMVERPALFLGPTLLLGLVVVLVGDALRRRTRWPAYVVAVAQVDAALLGINLVLAAEQSLLGVVPTPASIREVVGSVYTGFATLNYYTAPVEVNEQDTRAVLLCVGLGIVLAVDLVLTWWRKPPVVALPLLLVLSVPVSILREALALPVFVGTALLFVRLLGAPDGRTSTVGRSPGRPAARTGVLWQVAVAAVLLALLVAPGVPVTNLLDRSPSAGPGNGTGGGDFQVTSVNPFIRLRRDLVERTNTPMVFARTEAPRTSYLRTTVLDEFTSQGWNASTRVLPASNTADGRFPSPPGLSPRVGGRDDRWELQLAPSFLTTWLPIPFPLRSLDVEGSWRYDSRTLDVTNVGAVATSSLRYSATSFTPRLDAALLESSTSAPSKIQVPNTEMPRDLPAVIGLQARNVTRGATNNYERAVALQEWFRSEGGFRYSLEQRPGSGMELLASFVTDDRVGYCEQYAAAMAAMGRALGIPSRVVVGFLDGTSQPDGRVLYTTDDRHAWPEMYFAGIGWVRFEPTPGQRAGATPPWTRLRAGEGDPTRAPGPRVTREPRAEQAPDPASQETGADTALPWRPVSGLVLLGLLAALPAVIRREQRRRRLGSRDPVRLSEGAWAELRATALDVGVDWPDERSPREQATVLAEQVPASRRRLRHVEDLLVEVERGRFGPPRGAAVLTVEQRAHTVATLDDLRQALVEGTRARRSWWSRMWPASVWQPLHRGPGRGRRLG